jgi:DNA (cytosine-5)-methyltransferase 1
MTIVMLDMYCKAGGCSEGYVRAAEELGHTIEITGVDIEPQPNYPYMFVQGDAIEHLNKTIGYYTHYHASPPCQEYSRTKSLHTNTFADLLIPTREALNHTGRPYVIENVLGAKMKNAIILDGPMFGLKVIRKRKFESNKLLLQPGIGYKNGSIGGKNSTRATHDGYYTCSGHQMGTLKEWQDAMGINWMKTKNELAEAIPPAYTHWLGLQLFAQ